MKPRPGGRRAFQAASELGFGLWAKMEERLKVVIVWETVEIQ